MIFLSPEALACNPWYRATGAVGKDGMIPVETFHVERVFSFEAGAFIRGQIIGQLREAALRDGVGFEHAETRGWLASSFTCRVSGQSDRVAWYTAMIASGFAAWGSR